jgi:hypothetical protein
MSLLLERSGQAASGTGPSPEVMRQKLTDGQALTEAEWDEAAELTIKIEGKLTNMTGHTTQIDDQHTCLLTLARSRSSVTVRYGLDADHVLQIEELGICPLRRIAAALNIDHAAIRRRIERDHI